MFYATNNSLSTEAIISLRETAALYLCTAKRVNDTQGAELRSTPSIAYALGETFSEFGDAIKAPLGLGSDYESEYEFADQDAAVRIFYTAAAHAFDAYEAAMDAADSETFAAANAAWERDNKREARNKARRGY